MFMALTSANAQNAIDLSGDWQFRIDRDGGCEATSRFDDHIQLPGSMLTRGKGDDLSLKTRWVGSIYDSSYYYNPYMEPYRRAGRMKFPFFLTPDKHYVGSAWYRRSVTIPAAWRRHRVILFLERPHIETTVYVNGVMAGHQMSLSVPHQYDITGFVTPGKANQIAIRVYNGIENVCVGQDSHSVTDQTQGDWNGIVGRIELQSFPKSYIRGVKVYPDIEKHAVKVVVSSLCKDFDFSINGSNVHAEKQNDSTFVLGMGDKMQLWDEFSPTIYTLAVSANRQTYTTTFGMREISIRGRQIYLNGKPIWIRGTVENCDFPLTGYPPTDVASWMKIFSKCKSYGLNAMRFHSYCPPEAAFTAADSLGFYLQPEGPSWPNHGVKLGRGMKIDTYLMDETRRMTEAYGNHPSFVMLAAGNEPAGDWVAWCDKFVDYWKRTDPRRVYCGASVGGGWAWDTGSQYHVKGGARGLDWDRHAPQSADDYYGQITRFVQKGSTTKTFDINEPFISHEQGQWCAFPDLQETSQYTGAYKARNFEIFADLLRDNGMSAMSQKFLHASGCLQTLAYKYEIERNLRTPDYAGFVLLGLNDYSGQGTALVGPLNVFWREKGYCTAAEWSRFCAPVVPLARFPRFTYTNADTLQVPVQMYNAGRGPLKNARTTYFIHDAQGNEYTHGLVSLQDIPVGKCIGLGTVSFPLDIFSMPVKLTLTVISSPENGSVQPVRNQWDFWVYPASVQMPAPQDVLITDTLDQKALTTLRRGGKVLITAAGKVRYGSDIVQTYLPVFWNTSWFKMRPPHTTGVTIDATHPLFREFPTDDWGNLNWWELLNKAQVMNFAEFPKDFQPTIQSIDTWHVSRKIGMLFEANVLGGKLIMTTMDITDDLSRRIVARQMRKAILDYMHSTDFRPSLTISPRIVTDLFERQSTPVNMYTHDSPDELKPKLK